MFFRIKSKHSLRRKDILKRIKSNINIDKDGCWIWQTGTSGKNLKGKTGRGYGRIAVDGTTMAVHRVIFTNFYGIIPHKKHIDHTCGKRLCCNPEHLEMVTHKENCKRRDNKKD